MSSITDILERAFRNGSTQIFKLNGFSNDKSDNVHYTGSYWQAFWFLYRETMVQFFFTMTVDVIWTRVDVALSNFV